MVLAFLERTWFCSYSPPTLTLPPPSWTVTGVCYGLTVAPVGVLEPTGVDDVTRTIVPYYPRWTADFPISLYISPQPDCGSLPVTKPSRRTCNARIPPATYTPYPNPATAATGPDRTVPVQQRILGQPLLTPPPPPSLLPTHPFPSGSCRPAIVIGIYSPEGTALVIPRLGRHVYGNTA